MYLLDTNVISELRRVRPHGAVLAWLLSVGNARLFLSAVTIGEIQLGIERTRAQDINKAREIESWLNEALLSYDVLPMTATCFREWAMLMANESNTRFADMMIAATALAHDLTVVTRNFGDFENSGVRLINPFEYRQ
jgi:toxin FitB